MNTRLSGCILSAAFSQSKNELVLGFNNDSSLVVSCEPARNALFLRDAFSRARKNSLDFFSEIRGSKVLSVSILPADREVVITLEGGRFIRLQLYGSKANIFLTDERRKILDAFLRPRESSGQVLEEPHPAPRAPSAEEFESRVQAIGHLPAFAVVKNIYPLYGSVLVREVFHRAGVNEQKKVTEVHQDEVRRMYTVSREVLAELMTPAPRIYFEQENAVLFSLIELGSCAHLRAEPFDSLHEAIRVFLQTSRRRKDLLQEKAGLESRLSAELKRLERTLAKMAQETAAAERIAQYELYGKLLKASLHLVNKGVDAVVLENMFSPSREQLEIPLDPHLTGARNADRYFAKAKKARHSLEEAGKRRGDLHERYDLIKRLSEELRPVQTLEAWETYLNRWRDPLAKAGFGIPTGSKPVEQLPPFRLFTV
ncbi:MAG TPA: NFACT family protein, partial [Bacteroidota bacterium]